MGQQYEDNLEFSDDVSQEEIDDLMRRAAIADQSNINTTRTLNSLSGQGKDSNFLHLQISTSELLAQLEHFYRGSVKKEVNGQITYEDQKNTDLVTFNEYGVTTLMEIVTKYIDRNTILSNYSEERVYQILGDLGDELILVLLSNYAQLGMDTYFKKTKFRPVITTTLHIIESTYRRAIGAKTLEEMNQSKVIGQFGDQSLNPMMQRPRRRGLFSGGFGRAQF
jgi:hypothetical protein